MIKKLIPNIRLGSIFEITPELLKSRNISLLMLDLDNTIAPYRGEETSEMLMKWMDSLKESGVKLAIVSNTRTKRAKIFAEKLNIAYVDHAHKPFTAITRDVMKKLGAEPSEAALAGDQIFTDVLCANSAGIMSIIVKPIDLKNVFYLLRYGFETIFRNFAPKQL